MCVTLCVCVWVISSGLRLKFCVISYEIFMNAHLIFRIWWCIVSLCDIWLGDWRTHRPSSLVSSVGSNAYIYIYKIWTYACLVRSVDMTCLSYNTLSGTVHCLTHSSEFNLMKSLKVGCICQLLFTFFPIHHIHHSCWK